MYGNRIKAGQGLTEVAPESGIRKNGYQKIYGRKKGLAYVRQFYRWWLWIYGDGMWNDGRKSRYNTI